MQFASHYHSFKEVRGQKSIKRNGKVQRGQCDCVVNIGFFLIFLCLQVDILCNDELLGKDHTLKFVYVTRWRFRDPPLRLQFRPRVDLQIIYYKSSRFSLFVRHDQLCECNYILIFSFFEQTMAVFMHCASNYAS